MRNVNVLVRGCVLLLCMLLQTGCPRVCYKPQFVVLNMETHGSFHALFSFDLKELRKYCVVYVDKQGKPLSRAEGLLSEDTFARYQKMLEHRKRSSEASIVVVKDGEVQLKKQDLDDLRSIVSNAPPRDGDWNQMHPSFINVFRMHQRKLQHD